MASSPMVEGKNSVVSRAAPFQKCSTASAPLWRVLHFLLLVLLTLTATFLAISPRAFEPTFALALGLFLIFIFPGYLISSVLLPSSFSLSQIPTFFVFSLALWAIPATALQLVGANWFAFRVVFVLMLWALLIAALARRWRAEKTSVAFARSEIIIELGLALLGIVVAFLVARGARDADDWLYLQVTQQFIGSDPFQIFAASEARYSVRYAFHVWIFLQAYLGEWLNADVVMLLRDLLPTLVAPLALLSFYAWGKTFFGAARGGLIAVCVQLLIYVTFANGDGWGRGFFARSAQDKFLVWLIVLPIALMFAWNFLRAGKFSNWFAYLAAMIAGLWVHPVSLFLVVLSLGGFALFNFFSRAAFPRRRWFSLTIATLPALLAPLVIRATTLPSVFTVNTPEVEAYMRLSDGRLLFRPPFYLLDPALLAHPILLFSFALLVLYATRWRDDMRVQFLWGATLVPLALLFNPFTARILGEMLTPWQLWRMTWGLPVAFIFTQTFLEWRALPIAKWNPEKISLALILLASAAFGLSSFNLERSLATLQNDHALQPSVQDMMQTLHSTLREPSTVLLPRNITRYASAYTHNARLLSNDAQKDEDARGKQIDRFYAPNADPKFLEAFLNFWEIEYVVAPNNSLAEKFVRTRAGSEKVYGNGELSLYRVR